MGNIFKIVQKWFGFATSNDSNTTEIYVVNSPTTVYSWDRKPKIGADQLRFSNLVDQTVHKSLISLSGQQLTLDGCSRSLITVSDGYSDSIFIDDCTECKIILSPVKGSVFLRNCRQCLLVVAGCGQFRTRDCKDVTVYLHCASQPSIETSVGLQFNCVSIDYSGLGDHLMSAKLDPAVNMWSSVFDFTPLADDDNYQLQNTPKLCNWRLLAVEDRLKDRFTETELLHCTKEGFDFEESAIPLTHPSLNLDGVVMKTNAGKDISDNFFSIVLPD